MPDDPYTAPKSEEGPVSSEATQLSSLDWLGVGVACLFMGRLITFSFFDWRTLLRDFGTSDQLPAITRFVAHAWAPPLLAIPATCAMLMTYRARRDRRRRRTWMMAAGSLAFVGIGVCASALYIPIFVIAEQIKAE